MGYLAPCCGDLAEVERSAVAATACELPPTVLLVMFGATSCCRQAPRWSASGGETVFRHAVMCWYNHRCCWHCNLAVNSLKVRVCGHATRHSLGRYVGR